MPASKVSHVLELARLETMDMAQSYLVDSNWKLSVGSFAQYRQNLSVGVSPEPLKTDDQSSRNSSELQTCETFRLRRILEGICQDGLLNCPFDYSHSGSHSIQLGVQYLLGEPSPMHKVSIRELDMS